MARTQAQEPPREPGTVRLNVVLPASLEANFRDAIYQEKGMKKGNISEAFVEAVQLWLDKVGYGAQRPKR